MDSPSPVPVVLAAPCTPHSLRVAVAHPVEGEEGRKGRRKREEEREGQRREGGRKREGEREGGREGEKERGREKGKERGREKGKERRREWNQEHLCLVYTTYQHTPTPMIKVFTTVLCYPTKPTTHYQSHSTPMCKNKCTSIGVCTYSNMKPLCSVLTPS